jgi:hypothetical protein
VLLKRYIHDVFDEEPSGASTGDSHLEKGHRIDGELWRFRFYDSATDVESGSLGRALPKTLDALACIFDVSEEGNNQRFRNIDYNFDNVRRIGHPINAYAVCGNKTDVRESWADDRLTCRTGRESGDMSFF